MKRCLIILPLFFLFGFSNQKLIKTKINSGITVGLPEVLEPMTPEDIIQRYPSVRAPLGAFTNPDRLVDFCVNISATQWKVEDAPVARKFFKSTIYSMYDRVEMLSEGEVEIHKQKYFFFEFDSRLNSDRKNIATQDALMKYTYIMYLVQRERTLVFSFNCTKEQKEDWQPIAKAIMHSIRVK
jgi:hypothetical protein